MRVYGLLAGLWLCSFHAGAAEYQFEVGVDVDRDQTTGCISTHGISGSEWRISAASSRTQVVEVQLHACRDGTWELAESLATATLIGFGQGLQGSDRIEFALPSSLLALAAVVDLRFWSSRADGLAGDVLNPAGEPAALQLTLGEVLAAVPAISLPGLLLLGLALLWAARRGVAGARRPMAALLLAGLLIAPLASAWLTEETRASLEDPANDVGDAGSDIVQAGVRVVDGRLALYFDVNNIENDGLPDDAKVLFIGNSLTYANELPQILEALAQQAGKRLITRAITFGGGALEDHYQSSSTLREITRGGYALVILQQGPSSLPQSQQHLLHWTRQFDPVIRGGGARPALYMVWPDITRYDFFSAVRDSYSNAALAVNGMFIPAGEAWLDAWQLYPGLGLYDSDQFHPSPQGSYTAALSMFAEIYRQTPVGLPSQVQLRTGQTLRFNPDQARAMQQAAWQAHLEWGRPGG